MHERDDSAHWTDDPLLGMPPDATPQKRKPGRPRKDESLPDRNGRGHSENGNGKPLPQPTDSTQGKSALDAALSAAVAFLIGLLKKLDFTAAGSLERYLLLVFRDTSYSESEYDEEFRAGGNAIGPTLAADSLARNTVDIVLAYGDRDFRVVAANFAKHFTMPDRVEYGDATIAELWFPAITAVVDAYVRHLGSMGIRVKGKCVVMATDGRFQGDFGPALEAFREWQRKDQSVVVVPAGFGDWIPQVVEKLSVNVKPVRVTHVSVLEFLNIVAKSIREASRSRAGEEREAILAQLARMKQE